MSGGHGKKYKNQTTLVARAAVDSDPVHGSVMPPIYMSSNFTFAGFDQKRPYDYTRSGNPTRDALGEALAGLEGGAGAVITNTGMSALLLGFYSQKQGQALFVPHDCYGGTHRLARTLDSQGFFKIVFYDQTDPAALEQLAQKHKPGLILIETPSNPLLRIADIRAIAKIARQCGALSVADNTFLSPILQQPIALGVDLVVHSTTKFLNGHSDVVGGAVIAATADLHEQMVWWANCMGLTGAPFDSYLTLRGLRTLDVRIRRQQENAQAVADFLAGHDKTGTVYYPGLSGHPGHALAKSQQSGFGTMLSFELKDPAATPAFVERLTLYSLAESLGGVESLIAHPATMTHAAMDPAAREKAGISDGLLRLSIGLEDQNDLIADLDAALSDV